MKAGPTPDEDYAPGFALRQRRRRAQHALTEGVPDARSAFSTYPRRYQDSATQVETTEVLNPHDPPSYGHGQALQQQSESPSVENAGFSPGSAQAPSYEMQNLSLLKELDNSDTLQDTELKDPDVLGRLSRRGSSGSEASVSSFRTMTSTVSHFSILYSNAV
jgi:hypothetical protein